MGHGWHRYNKGTEAIEVTSKEMKYLYLNGTAIHELPSSFFHNRKLCHLNLEACDNLNMDGKRLFDGQRMRSLTDLFLSSSKQLNASNLWFILDGVTSLTTLYLCNCCNLQALPDNIGLLLSLRFLNLEGSNVESLPDNIKNLSMIEKLYIDDCRKLEFVPQLPPSLQVLSATSCTSLKIIFNLNSIENVDGLRSLRELYLSNCCNLQILPDSISLLSSLEFLDLSRTNVQRLCTNVKNLCLLEGLFLDNCMKLVALPELPSSLKWLRAINCTSLETNFTQRLVLEQKLHTISYSLKHGQEYNAHDGEVCEYVLFPGAHVPNLFRCTTETSHLGHEYFISDHMMLWYLDIKYLHKMQNTGVNDHCNNISFEFKTSHKHSDGMSGEMIKGCGVLPVYATDLSLELGGSVAAAISVVAGVNSMVEVRIRVMVMVEEWWW
ncbi:hypothetical protein RIF29_19666 [Crotalaria pallida]|uniref:Uncharacterized protein n=1 Tax=Crotalaria pallida TaxID=3830 RepID=A0AAN9F877_CROPI